MTSKSLNRFARTGLGASLLLALTLYVAYCVVLYRAQEDIIFSADYRGRHDGAGKPPEAEQLWLDNTVQGESARTEAWYFRGVGRGEENPGPLVVLFHGNGDIIDHYAELARLYASLGCNVLLPEYRGYGRATGQPSEAGIVADSARFITDALARPEIDRGKIVLHGRSLGGGVATAVAARLRDTAKLQPAVLVLDCTFTSIAAMSARYFVPAFLVKHPFRTDRELPKLTAAVFITHGRNDRTISFSHAETLARLRPDAKLVPLDCGHLDFPGTAPTYEQELRRFLADHAIIAR
ncbi:MAG: alpha/beta hydrolase [Phycisphaerales bacterium]|nr:alpha/beta hydrolase [Phycisphaerales bacterium]